jgi:hypothetical protein
MTNKKRRLESESKGTPSTSDSERNISSINESFESFRESAINDIELPEAGTVRRMSDEKLRKLRHVPLAKFLTYPVGREAFRLFLVHEFSVENLLFVEAIKQFLDNPQATKDDARKLYDTFVAESGPNQVNLTSALVQKIQARLADEGDDCRTLFNEAVEHVMKLMQRDAYKRFQRTIQWQQHVVVFHIETDKHAPGPEIVTEPSTPSTAGTLEPMISSDATSSQAPATPAE